MAGIDDVNKHPVITLGPTSSLRQPDMIRTTKR